MDILLSIVMLSIGLFMILKGGDLFVLSSEWMARIAHIKEIIIGATIVSVGTTLPEFLTSLIATIKGVSLGGDEGYFALAMSNAVGSMLANTGLILAIVLIVRPPRYDHRTTYRSGIYVLLVSLLIMIFALTGGRISTLEGVTLLVIFVLFMIGNVLDAKATSAERCDVDRDRLYREARSESKVKMIAFFVVGAIGIGVGAMLLVENARALALRIGISEQLIGVTLVAVGTSLPELVTSITALRKGSTDIGVGNILGAHMINATLIIGIIAVVAGSIAVDDITRGVSTIVLVAIMAVLVLPAIIKRRFMRWQGVMLLLMYLSYIAYNIVVVSIV